MAKNSENKIYNITRVLLLNFELYPKVASENFVMYCYKSLHYIQKICMKVYSVVQLLLVKKVFSVAREVCPEGYW